MHFHARRHVSQIGRHTDLDALSAKYKSYGISRVVRNREREHFDVADGKAFASTKVLATIKMRFVIVFVKRRLSCCRPAHPALPFLMRVSGDVDGNLQLARHHAEAADMV